MIKTDHLWKEIAACKQQVNAATNYLGQPKKSRRWTPTICIGPRSTINQSSIRNICNGKDYPPLPILASNKELRRLNQPREKSPLFKVAASAIQLKYQSLKSEIKEAIEQEKNKQFIANTDLPLRIESTSEPLPAEIQSETLYTKELSSTL